MGNKIYFSQIQAKIDRLQRERTQVLEHLELVERKIQKLNDALEVMEDEALTDEYDTEVYSYRTYKHRFRGKLRPMVLAILKAQPDHYFTVNEITEIVLIKDGQDPIVRPKHTVSVRGALISCDKHCICTVSSSCFSFSFNRRSTNSCFSNFCAIIKIPIELKFQ
ncbi:DNA repair ATPase [Actinobacillus ureae]|uniref:DNA repair ATPase n=1 Tax=Actinobacillus ureae TaxID=723 RepID=UPI000E151878|nr:DNA repair ATPase [Actinobacillus ureae]SUT87770.1 DNA repair ATPase [Actinobacillus ureae]SUU49605.1 DNA repair ATPase [Actinobacillus ureae]